MRFLLFFAASLLLISLSGYAQQSDLLEKSFTGTSKLTVPQDAKKDIQDQAWQQVSEEVIKDLIGADRFSKNKNRIQSVIIKNSARYIPFSKPSQIIQDGAEFKMTVAMKVSLADLKQLLQNNALLGENDTAPIVLPLVSVIDRVGGKNFRWWLPIDKTQYAFLIKENRLLEEALRNSFKKENFYVIKPIQSGLLTGLPSYFHNEKLAEEDLQFISQFYNAPILIDGQVMFNKGERGNNFRIDVRLTALQVSNGRTIADVFRSFQTDVGVYENVVDKKLRAMLETTANDLSAQVFDTWQRGALGSSLIRVTVKGFNSPSVIEGLKDKIRSQITQIKNMRERLISSEAVVFELDASISGNELAEKIVALDWKGKKLTLLSDSQSANEIVLKWAQ